jgi:glycosyltransferase involved in cell wall biosynthesis
MRIFVTGTRGIPVIPGGVETHCENLYPLLAKMNCEVRLARRSSYAQDQLKEWQGVQLVDIYSPHSKTFEAIVHTFLSVVRARLWRADIVHIHAIGPSLLVPFARILGLKVVMTNHGPDYDREKWNTIAKKVLQLGEYCGTRFSNSIIVISKTIQQGIQEKYATKSVLIPNGVNIPIPVCTTDYIEQFGLDGRDYLLAVARFVPEKGLLDLIQAYEQSGLTMKLVIAGDSDHEDDYSRLVKNLAQKNSSIVLTGYITGSKLTELFSQAAFFVLPSYHEGLPIALLEALSYRLPVLASDIAANLEVDVDGIDYFQCGDIQDLSAKLLTMSQRQSDAIRFSKVVDQLKAQYNWQLIAGQTRGVYEQVLNANA